MVWPLETEGVTAFAQGKREILVVEEKRPIIEQQLKDALFNAPADRRPVVVGKTDERGQKLLKIDGELALRDRLGAGRPLWPRRPERLHQAAPGSAAAPQRPPGAQRIGHGARALLLLRLPAQLLDQGAGRFDGDGRHRLLSTLAINMERNTKTFTHMGAEGATWVGANHFTDMPHVFQNLGDGTYFHSGYMAIRHAIATNTTIYKILYDAVAGDRGQPHDGNAAGTISQQVHAEGVRRIALVSDEPGKYPIGTEWAPGVSFHHRSELDDVQRELARWKGVSVLIYDQTCAAEKRRRRSAAPSPTRPGACSSTRRGEGCGDCSVQSNCLSVTPVETEFGPSAPSTSRPATGLLLPGTASARASSRSKAAASGRARPTRSRRRHDRTAAAYLFLLPAVADKPYGVLITGIGGTGVVTIGAIMGTAAHIEGKGVTVLDQPAWRRRR